MIQNEIRCYDNRMNKRTFVRKLLHMTVDSEWNSKFIKFKRGKIKNYEITCLSYLYNHIYSYQNLKIKNSSKSNWKLLEFEINESKKKLLITQPKESSYYRIKLKTYTPDNLLIFKHN